MVLSILLASITGSPIFDALIWIVVMGVVFYILWWFIGYVGLPAPFDKVARVIIGLVAVIILIKFLLELLGNPF